ncbi:VWA domain-containing protein [Solicola sp. PLA-1-18]|uniref:VWA domain-containing protein n=1 Tax=Solicola sp. PLA-1-18 TaxID=3380532 RepID=UPI003B7BCEB6
MARATDEGLREAVRRLVPRLVLDQTRRGTPTRGGVGRRRTVPAWKGGELDLDRSMDAVLQAASEGRRPSVDELQATDWARPTLALCLVVDRSGSMNGARLTTAAVTAAACLGRAPAEHAVLAFAADVSVLKALDAPSRATRTVEAVLGLRGHGTTALSDALISARHQLARARARRRVVVLLSDCRATDDVDAVPAARGLDELVVLAPAGDDDEARHFARRSGARLASVASVLDVPSALAHLLQDDRP